MWRVVKPCIEQSTGRALEVGDIVEFTSAFDMSLLTAMGCVVPHVKTVYETQDVVPMERRKWGKRR